MRFIIRGANVIQKGTEQAALKSVELLSRHENCTLTPQSVRTPCVVMWKHQQDACCIPCGIFGTLRQHRIREHWFPCTKEGPPGLMGLLGPVLFGQRQTASGREVWCWWMQLLPNLSSSLSWSILLFASIASPSQPISAFLGPPARPYLRCQMFVVQAALFSSVMFVTAEEHCIAVEQV